MRNYSMFFLLVAFSGMVWAAGPQKTKPQKYLTAEDAILAQSKEWQKTGVAKPIVSDDGRVLYPFGQYMPTLICSTLHVCDIQLEEGETVTGAPFSGDSRVTLSPAMSGPNGNQLTIIVKAMTEGFETNFVIPTNRRVYRIKFVSSKKEAGDYMHSMGFYYPEDTKAEWDAYAKDRQVRDSKREKLVQTELGDAGFDMDKMDFDYRIEGTADFKPMRVFNNGSKTFIQFPESIRSGESPILMVLDDQEKPIAVNYRMKPYGCADADCVKNRGDMLVVDYLIKRAKLVLGVGNNLAKVDIRAKSVSSGWW